MNMDRFTEQVVVKKNRIFNEIMYYLSLVVIVILGFYAFFMLEALMWSGVDVMTVATLVISLGMAVGLFLMRPRLRTDYEYTFTNGALDFAMVFNNSKRKTLGSLNVRNVEAFGLVNSGAFQRYLNMQNVKVNRWFLNRDAELYFFFFQKDNAKKMIVLEPNEEMVDYIRQYLPHGVWQNN